MVKKAEVEAEVKGEPEITPEPKPTPEEEMSALRNQLGELETKLKDAGEEAKAHQRVATQKGQRVSELERQVAKPQTPFGSMRGMVDELERLSQSTYVDDPSAMGRIANLKTQITTEEQRLQAQAQANFAKEWRERLNQKIKEAGFEPTDERFADVDEAYDLTNAVDGNFERVDRKLDRILGGIKPKGEEQVTKPEELKLTPEQEAALEHKFLEKHDMLPTSTGAPSASGKSWDELRKAFAENPENPQIQEEYYKERAKRGL